MLGVLSSDPKGLAYVAVLSFPGNASANDVKNDGEVAHVQLILPHQRPSKSAGFVGALCEDHGLYPVCLGPFTRIHAAQLTHCSEGHPRIILSKVLTNGPKVGYTS